MKYYSTRDKNVSLSAAEAVKMGLSRDGGLFLPSQMPELDRRLRRGEMTAAADYMRNLGLDGFCQERTSAKEEYTPPFDLTGV